MEILTEIFIQIFQGVLQDADERIASLICTQEVYDEKILDDNVSMHVLRGAYAWLRMQRAFTGTDTPPPLIGLKVLFERLTSMISWSKEATQHHGVEREEQRAMIRRALERLPPKHKAVIVLLYFEERSCEEIAAILECSVGTVKSRLYHARQKLKELLTPYFEYGREINQNAECEIGVIHQAN